MKWARVLKSSIVKPDPFNTQVYNDPTVYSVQIQGTHGTASISGNTLTYTPHPGAVGTIDTLVIRGTDPDTGAYSSISFKITITA
jgi:Bacterial Ig domain